VYAVGSGPTATIYAATDSGLSVSTDGGANWAAYTTSSTSGGLVSNGMSGVFAVGSGPTATIYAATDSGLSVSTDGGANWTTYTTSSTGGGLVSNRVYGVYAVGSGPTATIYAATDSGLSVTTDGGANWTAYTTSNPGGPYYPWYGDTGELGSDHVYGGVYAVGSGPAARIYAATDGGLSISTTWPAPLPGFTTDVSWFGKPPPWVLDGTFHH